MRTPRRFRKNVWYQIEGDVNAERYGCTLARWTGDAVEIRKIQPTIEYVGEREAAEVGYPYWSRDGYYDDADIRKILETRNERGWAPLDYVGSELRAEDVKRLTIRVRFEVASAALDYGDGADEGEAGWSDDVLPAGRVSWWATSRRDWRAEDAAFRRMLRERAK